MVISLIFRVCHTMLLQPHGHVPHVERLAISDRDGTCLGVEMKPLSCRRAVFWAARLQSAIQEAVFSGLGL